MHLASQAIENVETSNLDIGMILKHLVMHNEYISIRTEGT